MTPPFACGVSPQKWNIVKIVLQKKGAPLGSDRRFACSLQGNDIRFAQVQVQISSSPGFSLAPVAWPRRANVSPR